MSSWLIELERKLYLKNSFNDFLEQIEEKIAVPRLYIFLGKTKLHVCVSSRPWGTSINFALISARIIRRIGFFPSGLAGAGQHRIIFVQRRGVCISHLRVGKGYVS